MKLSSKHRLWNFFHKILLILGKFKLNKIQIHLLLKNIERDLERAQLHSSCVIDPEIM